MSTRLLWFCARVGALVVAFSGCDDAIAPSPTIDAAVTLWGAFDPAADTQAVRIVRITPDLDPFSAAPFEVAVTSTDLATGAVVAWRDSLVAFGGERYGHVFLAPFRPAYGGTYRLDVAPAVGRAARATIRVPTRIEPVRRPTRYGVEGPVEPTFWPGVVQLNNLRTRYRIEQRSEQTGCGDTTLVLPFEGTAGPTEFGWEVEIPLRTEAQRISGALETPAVALIQITLEAEVASEDWRPRGTVFDPDLLLEPEGFSNVEGGFGFVGSAYPLVLTWAPDGQAAIRAGFQPVGFCNP